jgi:hypothetical protein
MQLRHIQKHIQLRHLEDDQRRSVKEETVTIETLARVNAWLVPELQQKYGRI